MIRLVLSVVPLHAAPAALQALAVETVIAARRRRRYAVAGSAGKWGAKEYVNHEPPACRDAEVPYRSDDTPLTPPQLVAVALAA